MRAALPALGVAAILGQASASCATTGGSRDAWFVRNAETGQWCAFVDEASAAAVADDGRFDWREAVWLKYGTGRPVTLLVTLQSEDAYVEDTYSFARDLSLTGLVRKGRYVEEPFFTATFRPDEAGDLQLTAQSAEAREKWAHLTYFVDWPVYRSFAGLPFAAQVETAPRLSVSASC